MLKVLAKILLLGFILLIWNFTAGSSLGGPDGQKGGPPPAKVVVAEVRMAMLFPRAEFIGTVFYQEVSDVASELSGVVEVVRFEEGQRIRKGKILVKLNSDLLRKSLEATIASHEQVLADFENAVIDFQRITKLYKEASVAEKLYDETRFRVKGFEKRAASLRAQVERFKLELAKKAIKAPFDGVVVQRRVDRGEWLSEGDAVATIAKDDVLDVVAEVPQWVLTRLEIGMQVDMTAAGKNLSGEVFAIIPKGDIATRTFPVKIRTRNTLGLIEGMEARVRLPTGQKKKARVVPRDAVIPSLGESVVFAVTDSRVRRIPVKVLEYEGLRVAIEAASLKAGMKVVVKGNERLRDGQAVTFTEAER